MPTLPAPVFRGHRNTFRTLSVLGLTSLLALALCGCANSGATAAKTDAPGGGGSGRGGGRRGGGDVPVTVAKSTTRDVPVEVQVIGNVEAYSTITVKALVGGQLTNVHFKEGDFVKKAEKLFDIDPRPLEAAYNQAVANIAREIWPQQVKYSSWRVLFTLAHCGPRYMVELATLANFEISTLSRVVAGLE